MSFLVWLWRTLYKVASLIHSATCNYQTLSSLILKCKCQESSATFLSGARAKLLPRHSQLICIAIMYSSSSLRPTALSLPGTRCCDDDNVVASSLALTFSTTAHRQHQNTPIALTSICGVFFLCKLATGFYLLSSGKVVLFAKHMSCFTNGNSTFCPLKWEFRAVNYSLTSPRVDVSARHFFLRSLFFC
jgi:hypothetical protein